MAVRKINPVSGSDAASATKRRGGTATLAIHTLIANCDVLDMNDYAQVAIRPPTGVVELTIYASVTSDGTFELVEDAGTAGVITVVAAQWQLLPPEIAPYPFIKLVATANTGNATIAGKS